MSNMVKFDTISREIRCTAEIDRLDVEVGCQKSEGGRRNSEVRSLSSALALALRNVRN